MKTINSTREIDRLLKDIDLAATQSINKGLRFTVEWRDDGITEKQFNSMHKWCRMCEQYLNQNKFYRVSLDGSRRIPWQEGDFKQLIYKPLLKAWKSKASTKDQNTSEPEEIRLALSGHLATAYKENILLPEWPSHR